MERIIIPLNGKKVVREVKIPASKSHTIRALLIASMADGQSILRNPLESADAFSCVSACRAFGAVIDLSEKKWTINGTGGKIRPVPEVIDVGNSGTTLYLATALAATGSGPVVFDGDEQIRRRSADKLLKALSDLGGVVDASPGGCVPYTIQGPLKGGQTSIQCPTSQYLSALLLAAPLAVQDSYIDVPLLYEQPYVEMTMEWLRSQNVKFENNSDLSSFHIYGNQKYTSFDRAIPADFSSATFFLCGAAVTGSELIFPFLDMTDTQGDKKVVKMLEKMGCDIKITSNSITISGGKLKGRTLDLNETPDALPAMAVAACFAKGKTKLVNVPQARIKETDRIAVMKEELSKLGAKIKERDDGLIIHGSPESIKGGDVSGHGDHRVIMSLAIAGLSAKGPVKIDEVDAASITFPTFFKLLSDVFYS